MDDPRVALVRAWFHSGAWDGSNDEAMFREILNLLDACAAASAPPPANTERMRAGAFRDLDTNKVHIRGVQGWTDEETIKWGDIYKYSTLIAWVEADVPLPATPTILARVVEEGR